MRFLMIINKDLLLCYLSMHSKTIDPNWIIFFFIILYIYI